MYGKRGRNIQNRTTSGWPHPTKQQWCTPVWTAGPLNGALLPITSHAACWLIYYVVQKGVSSSLGKWFKDMFAWTLPDSICLYLYAKIWRKCELINVYLLCGYMWFVFKMAILGQVKRLQLHHLKSHRSVGVTAIHSKSCKNSRDAWTFLLKSSENVCFRASAPSLSACPAPKTISKSTLWFCDINGKWREAAGRRAPSLLVSVWDNCLILSSTGWFTIRQVTDILLPPHRQHHNSSEKTGEKKQEDEAQDEEDKAYFIEGPPLDLDIPGPSSVVHKYHRPLNEQWRHKSIEMKLQMIMLGQRAPKAFIFRWP